MSFSGFFNHHTGPPPSWCTVWFVVLLLLCVCPHQGVSEEVSGNTTVTSTTISSSSSAPVVPTTPDPLASFDMTAANVIITAMNVSRIMYETSGYILQDVINTTLKQAASWGKPYTTIGIKNFSNKWDLLTLFFYSGRTYEKLVSSLKKESAQGDDTSAMKAVYNAFVGLFRAGINLTTDGLGYPSSIGGGDRHGSAYFLVPMVGGVRSWEGAPTGIPSPQCQGTRTIKNQQFKSFNLEVQFDKTEPIVVIAYGTLHLGIDMVNCPAVVEHHGNKAVLYNTSSYIKAFTSNSSLQFPILHISLDQHNLQKKCVVKVCSIREDHRPNRGGSPVESKPELLTIEFTGPNKLPTKAGRRLLGMSESVLKERCGTGTKIISAIQFEINSETSPRTGPYKTVCNGTKVMNGFVPPDLGCYSFSRRIAKVQCPTIASAVSMENGDCSYRQITEDCPDEHLCITVTTPGRGTVKVSAPGHKLVEDCNKECSFNVPTSEATLTCPNGEKHALKNSHLVVDCLWHKYSGLPIWFCRMSFHPEYIYMLISWYFLGYLLWRVFLSSICLLLRTVSSTLRRVRLMGDTTRGHCEHCSEWVPSQFHWQRHENCRNGRCPYCTITMSTDKLKAHPAQCLQRHSKLSEDEEAVTVRLVPFALRGAIVFLCAMSRVFSKAAWIFGLVIFFYLSIHPVYSLKETTSEVDLWEEEVGFMEFCDISCVQSEEECTCPVRRRSGRKLLGLFANLKKVAESLNGTRPQKQKARPTTLTKKRSLDVLAPWGTLHISDSFQPTYSGSHISLSWTESSTSDDHVILNGKSEAIIKLQAGTSLMWEISTPKSKEVRRVFVSILDFTQIYTSRFLYLTGDRTIESWMQGRCTGDCPDRCGCTSSLCFYNKYDDFTNWRCNPTWCWSIGQGCACCALGIKSYFTNWLASKWELNYVETAVIACVETSPEDRVCQEVSAGSLIQLGPISVQFSDPSGIEEKLPKDVVAFHKSPIHDSFDYTGKVRLADGRSVCDLQSCTHGPVGDLQLYEPTALFDHDHVNVNSIGNGKGVNDSNAWMSWSGTGTYYTCHPGNWPDCHSTGVVTNNGEAFENLYNSGDVGINWYYHTESLHMTDTPTMNIKGRPSSGAGHLTALLEVQGLMLKSVRVQPEGLHLDVNSCTGCFACTTGFTCNVRVRITHPEQYGLHLISMDPDVVVPAVTIIAKSDTAVSQDLHFFSVVDKTNFCLRVKELDATKGEVSTCTSVSLTPPAKTLLEHRVTLHSTSNPNCTAGYFVCVAANAGSFFSGLGSLLGRIFGSLWGGIITIVIVAIIVLLLIFFGPSIFTYLVNCCKYRKGYRRVPEFDSIRKQWKEARQQVAEEKKKSKAAEDLLIRLSKAK